MNALGTTVPELTAEHRDGTIWADANLALWVPIPDMWGGGWMVTMQEPFTITQCAMPEATRAFGPYVAVLEPMTTGDDDGGGPRGD
ncbi:hypothetical protein SEA_FUNSIZED_69 [Mycobacterium phage Funsized]|nr:hypothetical protein SEA_FUNSIZED_69 [Mycobacterium phage Funsized]